MEVSLVERARKQLISEDFELSKPLRQVHREESRESSGMICSGEQTVILRKLGTEELPVIERCIRSIESGADEKVRITTAGLQLETSRDDEQFSFGLRKDGGYVIDERLLPENELFIIGGGHCALALSELMSKMDFRIVLYDDRPSLNSLLKNDSADEIIVVENYEWLGELLESARNRFVVVMTIGYKHDKIVMRELLNKDFRYFGVLGSKAKMTVLLRELKEEGMDAARLAAVRTPIGLDINSRSPYEIAVSIAAEIIAVKNEEKI